MPQLAASTWVDAPPDLVFRMIESPSFPLLPDGGPRFLLLSSEPGLGASYRWEFRRLGLVFRADSQVIEHGPVERLVFEGSRGWKMRAEIGLVAERGGTRLNFRVRYRFPFPLCWLIPGRLIRLGVWHALDRVRSMAESCAPSPL